MSAPASSTPRGTAPNASQITASVIKFRCLYTHDLRRKSKRWQDGYLRYHAFNRRIMVYDDQGNYIGDHHWRSADEVQDGDELELDMGALIQVGERMSTTQADISNLFDKKKSIQGSPTSTSSTSLFQGPSRTSTPVRSSGSSQTFRSLNDLLGIKKTQIGRLISPYEERHPPAPSPDTPESSERALKRQKVSSFARHPDERGTFTKRTSQAEVVDLTEADGLSARQTQNHLPTKEIHRVQKESASKAQSGAGKSRDTEETPGSSKVDPPVFKKPAVPTPPDPSNQVTEAATSTKKPTTTTTTRDAPFELGARNARHPLPANPPRQSSENGPLNAPIKTLRMVSGKPRRKLMYSALIPTDTSQKSTPKSSFSSPTSRSQPLSDPLESQPSKAPLQEIESTNAEFMPSDSTQFILEEMIDDAALGSERRQGARKLPITSRNPVADRQPPSLPRHSSTRRPLDAPLRKSLSDPSALRTLPSKPTLTRSVLSDTPELPEEHEEGPWTSEALDLFDFWPPGRPKPN